MPTSTVKINGGANMKSLIKRMCLTAALASSTSAYAVTPVDIELQLLVDISASIDTNEYDLQLQGYANAFKSDRVQNAIINGSNGQIAVQLIMWSGRRQQEVMIDWSLVDSETSSDNLADQIAAISRPFAGWTGIGSAIDFAYPLFDSNTFNGTDQIIDISGDGTNNTGMSPSQGSQNALDNGVDTINGIVITSNQSVVDQYLNEVIGGETPFLLAPANFDDFQLAIENKIVAEIAGTRPPQAISVNEPTSLFLLGLGLIFVSLKNRKS